MATFRLIPPPRAFYLRDTELVAKDLLGKILVRELPEGRVAGLINETEAYLPFIDEASHGYIGETKRNQSMFLEGGHAYVHTLRHHTLLSIVTEGAGVPGAALARSVVPIVGQERMAKRRGKAIDSPILTNGPGKIGQAFQFARLLDGTDLTSAESGFYIADSPITVSRAEIQVTTRIGITKAADKLLRFFVPPALMRERYEKEFGMGREDWS